VPVTEPVGGGGPGVDPEELRYAPRPPRRRAGLRRTLFAVLALLLLAAVLGGAYAWTQTQYYVAADGGHVAIYRGVQVDLPVVDLSHPIEVADTVTVADLPPAFQQQVAAGIVADDLSDARQIVKNLTGELTACPTPSPSPSPSSASGHRHRAARQQASAKASPRASGSRAPSPRSSTSPSPTPSPSPSGTGTGGGTQPCTGTGSGS
jgi:protein phosphatase